MRRFIKPQEMRAPRVPKLVRFCYKDFSTAAPASAANVRKSGRGVPDIPKLYLEKCSCSREKSIVFCRACGYYVKNSRVSLACMKHPRVKFLHDLVECPRCHSSAFLDEV